MPNETTGPLEEYVAELVDDDEEEVVESASLQLLHTGTELTSAKLQEIEHLEARSKALAKLSHSERTRALYDYEWSTFERWCIGYNYAALPAEARTVKLYITALGDGLVHRPPRKKPRRVTVAPVACQPNTIRTAVSAIRFKHIENKLESPTDDIDVKNAVRSAEVEKGTAVVKKNATLVEHLQRVSAACKEDILGVRDRALLLFGFSGAFRRSSLVSLNIGDLVFNDKRVVVTIRKEKTDQKKKGRVLTVPYAEDKSICPVTALKIWLEHLTRAFGNDPKQPVFVGGQLAKKGEAGSFTVEKHSVRLINKRISSHKVALVLKDRLEKAGYSETEIEEFSGHSLRSGYVTVAIELGHSPEQIMEQTGHKKKETLYGYVRSVRNADKSGVL